MRLSPRHITLMRYRVTPEHLSDWTRTLEEAITSMVVDVQKIADNGSEILQKMYSRGFDDGYSAALLDTDKDTNGA